MDPKNVKQRLEQIFAVPSLLEHHSQETKGGSHPDFQRRWMDKQNLLHAHYRTVFSLKKEGNLSHAKLWINFEDIMTTKIIQIQKTNTVWPYLYEVPKRVKFIKRERIMMVFRGWGQEQMGSSYLMGTHVQLEKMRTLGINGSDTCTTMSMHLMPINCTFRNY